MPSTSPSLLRRRRGFTILEIMVVATIIGLIASIAIPAYQQSRQNSIASRCASDFRQFGELFQVHALQQGDWPDDGYPGTIPDGLQTDLANGPWQKATPIGGLWDFDYATFGFTAAVSIDGYTAQPETLLAIDRLLDDGNLSSGMLRQVRDDHLSYILAE